MTTPLIGLTLDVDAPRGLSKAPHYSLRATYTQAVTSAGGMPICLPHEAAMIDAYADTIAGLVVTGGGFDVNPALYGDNTKHATVTTKEGRTHFEFGIVKAMLKRNKPVLGICGGEQLINVILGGTLIQHIEDEVTDSLLHEQPNPRTEAGHKVTLTEGSLLQRIVGAAELPVNSAHHQAVKSVGAGVVVNATAPDGVIEGIEDPRYKFCLGVQWHPELNVTSGDGKILTAFVAATKAA
ncbi:gamma-glutamyl-gamma-aminobutyrate hydrolase family protein [Dongia rigui]|uniref:Gamma-glutamyl-gamma-aminobutyrate hydrolase family protein n=1 Tax=Dongia rigui TaxID=940149 RepID=A0ABU5E243_9PROT|nr:gamma-glutamyl-gamma-aminobutyrate hydrolase family protein [Dongia rigui]MDY0873432.1 gamma-glutamyl-gamma-aminobutyrate hydrolase family protein [Dongia rigui]